MIASLGIVGTVVEFMAKKLIGKRLDIALDDKRRACEAFWRLRLALSEVERHITDLLAELERVDSGRRLRLYTHIIDPTITALESSTESFAKAAARVYPALRIYEPKLASFICGVRTGKAAVLRHGVFSAISSACKTTIERGPSSPVAGIRTIHLIAPEVLPTQRDLDSAYSQYDLEDRAPPLKLETGDEMSPWKEVNLDLSIVERAIATKDNEAVAEMYVVLSDHALALKNGIDALDAFMRDRFALEDLMAATRGTSRI
ncbi:MAG: hypothetical protein JSV91_09195 [Phycisphaerales bacterium]|nr:MAG: hypothetical protein JSV91_09195 [Phycisphaerales bacterium]